MNEKQTQNMNTMPEAYAVVKGSDEYPQIHGEVNFFGVHDGTVVTARIYGLPDNMDGEFYGFHIHEGNACTGNEEEPFKDTGNHYNPIGQDHPKHVGDLPVLLGNSGNVWIQVYTTRFHPEDVVGKTVVIHDMADDFKSQPAGDSGVKIACGVIKEMD